MNTISQVEANEASTPAESGENVGSSSEDVCNGREGSYDNYNGSPTLGRSRYGRTIKPKPSTNNAANSTQSLKIPKTRRQPSFMNNSSESIDEINITNTIDEANGSSTVSSSTEEDLSSKVPSPTIECQWVVGQLAWARVGNFPYWPCVVTLDPNSMIYHKLKDSLTAETKKKDSKYAAGFVVKPGTRSKWENAVDEAMQVQPMTIEERAEIFAPKIKVSKYAKLFTEKNKNNKRKYSTDQDGPDAKRAKQDNVYNTEKSEVSKLQKSEVSKSKNSRIINGKIDLKLNLDSLPSSPSSHKSSHDNTNTKVDKSEEDEDGVFEVYYERNRDLLEDEYPNASEHDIKKYLRKTWDGMDTAFRKKYRAYMTRDSSHSKESTPDHEDLETLIEIDTSTREGRKKNKLDKEESSVSEIKRGRPYNLFKGKNEEQEDETFKCIDCLSGVAPACFICNEREGDRIRCIVPACGKHYHSKCLNSWPQSHWQGGRLTCPYHVCHTCSSDNPQDNHSRAPNEKIARGRAFLYQDGDANIKPMGKKKVMGDTYRKALQEANKIHQQLKAERSMTNKEPKGLKPPPYVNKPVGNVKPVEVESIVACECDPDWDSPCGPGTDCLNRILLVECSPGICPAENKCMNQSFVQRQYPAMEPFHTVGRGWGLKTLEDIKAGQFVIEYVGEVIDEAEYKRRLHRKKELKNENFYFLTIDNNRTIDAEPKGNLSRFMNHSCAPNCETQKWTVNGDTRIGLFALRDIESGEELTFNYNLASDGETRKACLCGASNCSGFIGLKAQKQQLPTKKIDKSKRYKRYILYILSFIVILIKQYVTDFINFILDQGRLCVGDAGKKYRI
ncbi:histone-lysine n-methyltransferase nsd2 [Lasius niger]|uniref:Histone-lysine n-methyltransferase nsd2 n=1 Tax=Lasius niger TaxID=67767 RepID=A0A0J7KPE9_LASNI|nr:histone-lysine n-methyltransferase nsd2 [Lasius niger]